MMIVEQLNFKEWSDPFYISQKQHNFKILDTYLTKPPVKMLDIGCGPAFESYYFYKKYGTELYLIDGDVNDNKTEKMRLSKWHSSSETFSFYNTLDSLRQHFDRNGIKNYKLIDSNNINIQEDVKFDLITSWLSCGFHYPLSTYKDLMIKHSHPETKIIVNLRVSKTTKKVVNSEDIEIVKVFENHSKLDKHLTAEIKFKIS